MADWWVTVEKYEMHDMPGLGECALGQELERLPPGDWRVTVHDDGKVDVVPLALAEMPWIRVDGRLAPIADRPLWFDAPEQENDR